MLSIQVNQLHFITARHSSLS